MARTFLKNIRVNSKQELRERILLGIKEINASPVVHRWNERLSDISLNAVVQAEDGTKQAKLNTRS